MTNTRARLLIIDDQPPSAGLLLAYLSDSDVDLLVALNGEDGLRIAREGRPDLILLDVQMPVMDGFSVCRQLKAELGSADIPVIFLSAAIEIEDKLRGFAVGGADYITKPFSEQEVLARVFVQLGERQRLQALPPCSLDSSPEIAWTSAKHGERRDLRLFSEAVAILIRQLAEPPSLIELAHRVGTNK